MADINEAISGINQEIGRLWSSYENAKSQNAELEAKIAQLEEMNRYVRMAKEHARTAERSIRKLSVDDSWKGKSRTDFDNECSGSMGGDAGDFYQSIDTLEGEVNKQIWSCRTQVNYFVKLMSDAEAGIQGLQRDISNLLSSAGQA